MDTNSSIGVVVGFVQMIAGALLALKAPAFQSRVLAFYRRNPHLRFDLGWTKHASYVALTRIVGVFVFSVGAALAALLWGQSARNSRGRSDGSGSC
jgi:hypothetical protein